MLSHDGVGPECVDERYLDEHHCPNDLIWTEYTPWHHYSSDYFDDYFTMAQKKKRFTFENGKCWDYTGVRTVLYCIRHPLQPDFVRAFGVAHGPRSYMCVVVHWQTAIVKAVAILSGQTPTKEWASPALDTTTEMPQV
eukprot:SAG31_NODE_2807_length_5065_cov_3.438180_4_plen_138_part_00